MRNSSNVNYVILKYQNVKNAAKTGALALIVKVIHFFTKMLVIIPVLSFPRHLRTHH